MMGMIGIKAYGKAHTRGVQKYPVFGDSDSAGDFLGNWAARVHRVTKNRCLDIVSIMAIGSKNIQVERLTM